MDRALPRAVLDSSVLVPAWSRLVLADLATARSDRPARYTPIWCEWIIAESWRVLTIRRLRRQPAFSRADERQLARSANVMLTMLLQVMELVSTVPPFESTWSTASDADDRPVWTAAVRSNAQFVVSHNIHHFPPRDANGLCAFRGIEFITAANFIAEVLSLDLDALAQYPIPPAWRLTHQRRL